MFVVLETFGIDWQLLIAQGVNFLILAGLLTWLLYKPVLRIVKERQAFVAKGVEDAERAAKKLAAADGEARSRIGAAEEKAESVLASARETASAERARIVKEAEERAASIQKDSEARARETAAKTLRDSEKEIARLAILAAEKTLRQP